MIRVDQMEISQRNCSRKENIKIKFVSQKCYLEENGLFARPMLKFSPL